MIQVLYDAMGRVLDKRNVKEILCVGFKVPDKGITPVEYFYRTPRQYVKWEAYLTRGEAKALINHLGLVKATTLVGNLFMIQSADLIRMNEVYQRVRKLKLLVD